MNMDSIFLQVIAGLSWSMELLRVHMHTVEALSATIDNSRGGFQRFRLLPLLRAELDGGKLRLTLFCISGDITRLPREPL